MTNTLHTDLPAPAQVALLVDGENISATLAPIILKEAEKEGTPVLRRVYGKAEHIAAWDAEGFRLIPTRPGKNAADLLLSIEAMMFALREAFETVVIATSDGDFLYLATQLRELGHTVIGLGEAKAPKAFRTACSRFTELKPPISTSAPKWPATKIIPQVREILQYTNRAEGWGDLSWINHHLKLRDPDFDSRHYGHPTLESLIEAVKFFELSRGDTGLRLRDATRRETPTPPTP